MSIPSPEKSEDVVQYGDAAEQGTVWNATRLLHTSVGPATSADDVKVKKFAL